MRYIMVTNFDGHWDQCTGGVTGYSINMLKNGIRFSTLKENTETIFIKRDKTSKKVERAWIGKVSGFKEEKRNGKDHIRFTVHIVCQIPCPEQYISYSEGWYQESDELAINDSENKYEPPFLSHIDADSWEEFEDNTFRLFRLIGIHNIYKYPRNNQKGLPDGLFKFGKIAVIYDCTLDNNYEETKSTQIDNFCSQLTRNKIKIDKQEYDIKECDKFVWIITRNPDSRILKEIDDIVVKEVPIKSLISIYHERLKLSAFTEKQFIKLLQDI